MSELEVRVRIALLSYRSKEHSGGQGVYVRHLTDGLVAAGHDVEVFSGQPYPEGLDPRVTLTKVPSLDLYRDDDPFRTPHWREFRDWIDVVEYGQMLTAGFPEPLTFSLRVRRLLRSRLSDFDVVHDNQSLGWGLLDVARRFAFVTTIHHPISRDRAVDLAAAPLRKKFTTWRWYGFVRMQARVARRIGLVLGVSELSAADTIADFRLDPRDVRVVPLGVDTELFAPGRQRVPNRLVVVASADKPLKGLTHFLEAFARLRASHGVTLDLVSNLEPGGATERRIAQPDLAGAVTVHAGINDETLADLVGSAHVMVVPSLYEGFSLPAVEAMSSGTPLVASAAGALPSVVGDAGVLVSPGDVSALVREVARVLDDPDYGAELSARGRHRAETTYSWQVVAQRTVDVYEEAIRKAAHAHR